jgi:cytochrome P450
MTDLPPLPTERESPLHPPPEYARLREQAPISKHRWPNGVEAWLVTRYEDIHAFLGDPRLSIDRRPSLPPMLSAARQSKDTLPRSLSSMDPPEHTPRRQLYMRELTVRRTARLLPAIQAAADRLVDGLVERGPPAELVEGYARPLSSQVICELLGVASEDREYFQRQMDVIVSTGSPADALAAAGAALHDYVTELVRLRRKEPVDDILSRLATAEVDGRLLDEEEVVGHGMLLLNAGHETTASLIVLGLATLMAHPEQRDALVADPDLVDAAMEEVLRHQTVLHFGVVRRTTADIRLGDVVIPAGDWVVCSLASGNRDPAVYPDPDRFDIHREPGARQLSFGYGIHQCAGQHLSRFELRVALLTLFGRLPGVRLTRPLEELAFRPKAYLYSLEQLPVTW